MQANSEPTVRGETSFLCGACCSAISDHDNECPSCANSTLLNGRYRLLDIAGRGGSGTTYRGLDKHDGSVVAIKEILLHPVSGEGVAKHVRREVESFRSLDCPGIPRLRETFTTKAGRTSAAYVVREYVDGESLAEGLKDRRHTPASVFAILAEILDIVAYLHRQDPPIVHRDIKPENLIRTRDGRLVLIDFGSALPWQTDEDGPVVETTVTGTIGYMPPEQISGDASPASDMYAIGAVGIALLTRCDPVELLNSDHEIVWQQKCALHPEQERWLASLLQLDPADRPVNATRLAEEARELATREPPKGQRLEARRRGRMVAAVLGIVACAGLGALGLTKTLAKDAPGPTAAAPKVSETILKEKASSEHSAPERDFLFEKLTPGTSACDQTNSCADIDTGFEGLDLAGLCEDAADKREPPTAVVVRAEKNFEAEIAGQRLRCRTKDGPFGCSVVCFNQFRPTDWEDVRTRREQYVQYVRDRYGRELSADQQGLPDLPRYNYKWRSGRTHLEIAVSSSDPTERGARNEIRTYYERR